MGLVGGLGKPCRSWCSRACPAPHSGKPPPGLTSVARPHAKMSALMFGQLRAHLSRVRHGAYLVSGSHDACHGRLRGMGRRECWVPAAGGQGCLVVPTRGLLGVRGGGGGACDSQEVPGDRYLGRSGRAALTYWTPAGRGMAAHPTVFSRLAPGGRGRSRRPRAARGRVSVGARSPITNFTRFLRSSPSPTASSLGPPSVSP